MAKDSLRELYIDELRDLYNAETQLVKALPKMAKASSNSQLREAFEEHLRQTSEHVSRLEQIFEMLGEKATGKKCLGMEGLVQARYVVDTTGMVDTASVEVVQSNDPRFSESVRNALGQARFRPAIRAGKAVRQLVVQQFRFRIEPPAEIAKQVSSREGGR